jgi:CO dehydrogenase nickel-insertion accessory protein CooC1
LSVIAVDADEQQNLAATLGIGLEEAAAILPVAEDADYVEEKTGRAKGQAPCSGSTPIQRTWSAGGR